MNIKVTLAYQGKEGRVEQGIYSLEDKQLLGIPAYLLAAGHAEWTNENLTPPSLELLKDDHSLQLAVHAGRVVVEDGKLVTTKQSKSEIAPLLTELRERYEILASKKVEKSWDEGELSKRIAALENPTPRSDVEFFAVTHADEIGAVESLDELRQRYSELSGKNAFNGWNAETLRAKIAELESPNL